MTTAERLFASVRKTEACWLWTRARDHCGYGNIRVGGKTVLVHRLAWTLCHGDIPKGMHVLHRCDMPACVRPDHLFLGTHADNMRDMVEKGRSPRGERSGWRSYPERMPFGERQAAAKLSLNQVRQVIARYAEGGVTQAQLGREYGVSTNTINLIVHRKLWRRALSLSEVQA